ncbi:MAG: alpha/beta fold hydrolase [Gammaproteobacteria bacterium]
MGRASAALAGAACAMGEAHALDRAEHPPPGMHIGVGSHRLHIHCMGAGSPAVIFDSGLGGNSLEWVKVQPAVSRFTRACTYDRSGYGWSDPGPFPRVSSRSAEELSRLLVYASEPGPYVLVGHSIGGFNIRHFAHDHPSRTAGLVLVDAANEYQFERFEQAGIRVPIAPTGAAFVIANHWQLPEGLPAELRDTAQALVLRSSAIRSLYSELHFIRDSAVQVQTLAAPPVRPAAVIARGDPPGGSKPRALKMAGLWRAMQRELADGLPGSHFITVPGSGHHVHLDRPEVVIEAVRLVVDESRQRTVN